MILNGTCVESQEFIEDALVTEIGKQKLKEKDRYVPLPEIVISHINEYLEKYRMQSDQRAMFTTDKGRMTYQYLRNMIKKIGIKNGIPELHAHSFRHFYGTNMYRTTNDLRLVQILLGHARI